MVAKTQTLACMIMKLTKTTQEANDNLQAEIKLAYGDLAKHIDATQRTMQVMADKLGMQRSHKSKPTPKNAVRQPNIVPQDITDIDTVTQLTTVTSILKIASSATALKIRQKTVHFNAIVM